MEPEFEDKHWPFIDMMEGRLTGCHCGMVCSDEDPYGDTFVRHIYELGFVDGEAFRDEIDKLD